jgi:two-component system response regulator DegU
MQSNDLRVLVADDDIYFHELLSMSLERMGMHVVGVATCGPEILEKTFALKPDIILLDINLPGEDGLTILASLNRQAVESKVIVVSGYPDPDIVMQSMRLGASGFLSKQSNAGAVANAIRKVEDGEVVVDPAALRYLPLKGDADGRSSRRRWNGGGLTLQEGRVLQLLARGLTNKAIAKQLALSKNTVKTHLRNIYGKLGVSGRTEAAVWALRNQHPSFSA